LLGFAFASQTFSVAEKIVRAPRFSREKNRVGDSAVGIDTTDTFGYAKIL